MSIRVQVPGYGIVEFPDGTSEEQMRAALLKLPQTPQPTPDGTLTATIGERVTAKPRSWVDTAVDALPAIGGAVGGIVGGIGGTVAGFGVGGVPGAIGGAAVGGSGGEAFRQLINRARGEAAPGTSIEAAQQIGVQGAVQGGTEAVGGTIGRGAQALGGTVYRGYLKPSLSQVDLPKAREIVATGIREFLPITKGGEAKAARIIGQLNAQVEIALKQSKGIVDLHQIAERVREFARRQYYRPGAPSVDFDAAMKVADEIDLHPSLGIPAGARPSRVNVSPAQANETKQALDRAVGDTSFGVERGAATEARKQGRHQARLAIERVEPGVGPLNAREAKVIDALEAIRKAAGREENRSALFGVPTLMAAAAGGSMYSANQDPTSAIFTTLVGRGLLTPAVATRAALLAERLGQKRGAIPANVIRLAVLGAMRGLGDESPLLV